MPHNIFIVTEFTNNLDSSTFAVATVNCDTVTDLAALVFAIRESLSALPDWKGNDSLLNLYGSYTSLARANTVMTFVINNPSFKICSYSDVWQNCYDSSYVPPLV